MYFEGRAKLESLVVWNCNARETEVKDEPKVSEANNQIRNIELPSLKMEKADARMGCGYIRLGTC